MAQEKATTRGMAGLASKRSKNGKGDSKGLSALSLVLIALGLAGAFLFGMHFFAYLKTTTKTGFLVSLAEDKLSLLDLTSGSIQEVQMAAKPRFLDETGKSLAVSDWQDGLNKDEKARLVTITQRPDGKCSKVEEAKDAFCVEGEVVSVAKAEGAKTGNGQEAFEVKLGKAEYQVESGFFFEGSLQDAGAKMAMDVLGQGDVVKCWGIYGKILLVHRYQVGGSLKVTANVDGARVFINGVYQGKSPLTIKTSPGIKELMARLSGYKDAKIEAQVESGKNTEIKVDMKPIVGKISITSDPLGADVLLDGQLKGKTPYAADLPPGEYNCTLKLEGYYPRNFTVQVNADETAEIHEILTKMSSGGLMPIGNGTGGGIGSGLFPPMGPIFPGDKPPEGVRVTVLHTWPSLGAVEVRNEKGDVMRVAFSDSVPLKSYPFGTSSWKSLLPGEELVMKVGSQGRLEEATKTYAHTFSAKGKLVQKNEYQITVSGQKWADCKASQKTLVQSLGKDFPWNLLGPGDSVTVYGPSPDDIRYIDVEKPLGEKMAVEGFFVKTSTGFRMFNDSSMTNFPIPKELEVADPTLKKMEKAQSIPSGSRLNFYLNPVADIVFAQVVSRANVSLEGRIGSLSGASFFLMPSWQELFLNDKTKVFVNTSRRPYYDVKLGDMVLAAGPSSNDINFIWVEDRLDYERTTVGYMTSKALGRARLFAEMATSGSGDYSLFQISDTKTTFAYPSQKKDLSLRDIVPGDKLRLYIDREGKVRFGEVIEKNQLNLKGVYLGQKDGFYYFSGSKKLIPRKDLVLLGLESRQKLSKGSIVSLGGNGDQVNYIEVEKLLNPSRWIIGTFISGDRSNLRLYMDTYTQDFKVSSDFWFCDWAQSQDGPLAGLFPGDRVSLAIDANGQAVFAERSFAPSFEYEGEVTYVQGRYLTIKGKSGSQGVVLLNSAYVQRNGEKVSPWAIQKGDKVRVSGRGADWIEVAVAGR